jgi:hypothetical protein
MHVRRLPTACPICDPRRNPHCFTNSGARGGRRPPRARKRREPVRTRAAEAGPPSELREEWRPRSECFGSDAPTSVMNLTRTFRSPRPMQKFAIRNWQYLAAVSALGTSVAHGRILRCSKNSIASSTQKACKRKVLKAHSRRSINTCHWDGSDASVKAPSRSHAP